MKTRTILISLLLIFSLSNTGQAKIQAGKGILGGGGAAPNGAATGEKVTVRSTLPVNFETAFKNLQDEKIIQMISNLPFITHATLLTNGATEITKEESTAQSKKRARFVLVNFADPRILEESLFLVTETWKEPLPGKIISDAKIEIRITGPIHSYPEADEDAAMVRLMDSFEIVVEASPTTTGSTTTNAALTLNVLSRSFMGYFPQLQHQQLIGGDRPEDKILNLFRLWGQKAVVDLGV